MKEVIKLRGNAFSQNVPRRIGNAALKACNPQTDWRSTRHQAEAQRRGWSSEGEPRNGARFLLRNGAFRHSLCTRSRAKRKIRPQVSIISNFRLGLSFVFVMLIKPKGRSQKGAAPERLKGGSAFLATTKKNEKAKPSHYISSGTKLPRGATHFMVYSKNDHGEYLKEYAVCPIVDTFPPTSKPSEMEVAGRSVTMKQPSTVYKNLKTKITHKCNAILMHIFKSFHQF